MKRHQALVNLSREHYEGLVLAQLSKKNAPVYKHLPNDPQGKKEYVISAFIPKIKNHFKIEETLLIPKIKNIDKDIDLLTDIILNEHKILNELIEKLKTDESPSDLLNEFGKIFESHIRKEEREWFNMIQEKIPEDILEKIRIDIEIHTALKTDPI
jgi:hemerythrin-like domain-containing protein